MKMKMKNKKEREKRARKSEKKASVMRRLVCHDSGKKFDSKFGVWNEKKAMSRMRGILSIITLFIMSLILIISLIIVISALTSDERIALENELNSLEGNLSDLGYNRLVNYLNRGIENG